MKETLHDLIFDYPLDRKNDIVLTFLNDKGEEKVHYDFEQLEELCNYVAQNLALFSHDREMVLISLKAQEDFVVAFFGCIIAGKIPVPLPVLQVNRTKSSWSLLNNIIRDQPSAAVLIDEDRFNDTSIFLKEHNKNATRIYTIQSLKRPTKLNQKLRITSRDEVAYIQYTSGSTDMPKGIVLTHSQVLANLSKMRSAFNRGALPRVVGWIPFHHDMGLVGHLFSVLYESGFGAFMTPVTFLSKPKLWLSNISKYSAKHTAAPTFAFDYCVDKIDEIDDLDLSCLEQICVGSEHVSVSVLSKFVDKFKSTGLGLNMFRPVYGLAESTLLAAGGEKPLDELKDYILDYEIRPNVYRKLMPYPIINDASSLGIYDLESEEKLEDGKEGEIWIDSNHNYSGYLSNKDINLDAESILVKTGDFGFIKNNHLYITGRVKDVVVIRGVNYAAEDIEHCLRFNQKELQPNDGSICVQSFKEDKEVVLVFQEVHRHMNDAQASKVVEQIKANLAESFNIAAHAIMLLPRGTMPRTENYKISRNKCLELYEKGTLKIIKSIGSTSFKRTNIQKDESSEDSVVIVGMACRFPGGINSLEDFWQLLEEGRDAISEIPKERWDNEMYYDKDPAVPGKINTKWGGFIDKIDHFDPGLFGISHFEASEIDPQQRLLLETSWRLIENIGWTKKQFDHSNTGVFVGISTNDYLHMKIKLTPGLESFNAYSGLGNAQSIAANRLSYFYNLHGPSMAVDTACSSSLTAFHLGVSAIQQGECEQAIVGGVNAILSPGLTVALSQFGMMAKDGRCKTFANSADGYVRSEGCGLIMLKSRSAALRDKDAILATVLSTATAQDGRTPGITFPNGIAQNRLIQRALDLANIDATQVSYVEAHGTGTVSGDPIEMKEILHHYGSSSEDTCYVGSVKANIGHLEASAGVASLIKTVLMFQRKKIPGQLHLDRLNPKIQLANSRIKIPRSLSNWDIRGGSRKAAVSSFGFGGSLAHVILEEAGDPRIPKSNIPSDHMTYPFVLSGHNQESLKEQVSCWIDFLEDDPIIPFPDLCNTQANYRTSFGCRTYFLASDKPGLLEHLKSFRDQSALGHSKNKDAELCFLFTGQGEHYPEMGESLYFRFPTFKKYFDRCLSYLNLDVQQAETLKEAFKKENYSSLNEQQIQPIQFALQYSLGMFLIDLGLTPDYLLGYSFGEYVAACLAGCFEPEIGMMLVQKRGQLMDQLNYEGAMITIFAGEEDVREVIKDTDVTIAILNSPTKTVVSGGNFEISVIYNHYKNRGVKVYYLKTKNAYHSKYVASILEPFQEYLQDITFRKPNCKWISSVTGDWMTTAPGPEHWILQTRNTVQFSAAASCLRNEGNMVSFVEVGPGASTLSAIHDNLSCRDVVLARTLAQTKRVKDEGDYILDALGQLWTEGFDIDWNAFYNHKSYPASIPGYRFFHKPYWVKGMSTAAFNPSLSKSKSNHRKEVLLIKEIEQKDSVDFHQLSHGMLWKKIDSLENIDLSKNLSILSNWLLIGDSCTMITSLADTLKSYGHTVFKIGAKIPGRDIPDVQISELPSRNELFEKINRIVNLQARRSHASFTIIFVANDGTDKNQIVNIEDLNNEVEKSITLCTNLIQALEQIVENIPLWIVTHNAQAINTEQYGFLQLGLAPLWGFAKTVYLEHPELRGGLIDLTTRQITEDLTQNCLKKIVRPLDERCVIINGSDQYVEKIERVVEHNTQSYQLRDDGAYIVTGGLGGLGLETSKWLVSKGIKHLILISRRSLPKMVDWEQMDASHDYYSITRELITLKKSVTTLEIESLDVRDIVELQNVFDRLDEVGVPVRGVIHTAGVNWYAKVVDLNVAELIETMKIKVASSWALHQMTIDRDLDCFIMYSSVSALWGSVKLSHYSAANYFMDMLSKHRSSLGLPSLSINWGPWAEVGMSAGNKEIELLGKIGLNLMSPTVALNAMDSRLTSKDPLSLIADIDWNLYKAFADFSLRPSLFDHLIDKDEESEAISSEGVIAVLQSSADKARELIEKVVRSKLRSVMLIESLERVDEEQRFNFMGMDSLMAISFVVELEQYFNIKIHNTLPYNYPNIRAVSDFLFDEVYVPNSEMISTNLKADISGIQSGIDTDLSVGKDRRWLRSLKDAGEDSSHTLICVPYAGSGCSVFEKMTSYLPDYVSVVGVQAPGREERADERPHQNMDDLVSDLLQHFEVPESSYSLFGHSLGGLIVYELYLKLMKEGKRLPDRLIISGATMGSESTQNNWTDLADDELVDKVLETFSGVDDRGLRKQAVANIKEVMRADISILESYNFMGKKIDIPITVIAGTHDLISPPNGVKKWIDLVKADFTYLELDGAHNLLHTNLEEMVAIIKAVIDTSKIELLSKNI